MPRREILQFKCQSECSRFAKVIPRNNPCPISTNAPARRLNGTFPIGLISASISAIPGPRVSRTVPRSSNSSATGLKRQATATAAIAAPLFCLFGPDALLHRLNDSRLEAIRGQLPRLEGVFSFDEGDTRNLNSPVENFPDAYEAAWLPNCRIVCASGSEPISIHAA
jgi:hypothetical protein